MVVKEFIKNFHKKMTQTYNKATALVLRLQKKIIYKIYKITK